MVLHDGAELQANHATAEKLDVVSDPDLVHGAQNSGRIRRIGRDINDVRLGGLERTDDAGEFHRVGRIGLIEDDLHVALGCDLPRGLCEILGEFLVRRQKRDGLAADLLAEIEERSRPAVGRPPRRIVEPHVVADLAVHLKREVADQQQAALLDQRHDRRRRHGRIGRKQEIDLVDVEQLRIDRRGLRGARLVVIDDKFDLATEQAAPWR